MRKLWGVCVWVAILCGSVLYAQEYRGRIQGTVVDTSKAVVVGADVRLVNVATQLAASMSTNETGHYLFDLVEPGTYTVTVELQGFTKFQAENVVLQQRGDVTVDAALAAGSVNETVTVSAQSTQVQFNSSKLETTVDSKIAANLPQLFRDPFFMVKVDPTVVQSESCTNGECQPFNDTGVSTGVTIGAVAASSADLQVDGAPVSLGRYAGYTPTEDMVEEVNVQQNAVDAEFGNSAGAAISVLLKSGTNQLHGSAYYQGMYPWANAISDRVNRTMNVGRNHVFGGTVSHPIKHNKWFNFVAFEGWQMTNASLTVSGQLPTALEEQGNFSQSLNGSGGPRTIYDPWTTQTSANGATVSRMPFPGNMIPASRISPIAAMYTAALPQANLPGTGPYHALDYIVPLPVYYPYRNFSDRTDYVINDRLRYNGRVSLFRTPGTVSSPTGNDLFFDSERGSNRNANQITNDITWTKSATTVINGSFNYYGFVDSSHFSQGVISQGQQDYAKMWPNSQWYAPMFASGAFPMVPPGMEIDGGNGSYIMTSYSYGIGANGPYWIKNVWQDDGNIRIAHQSGKHYLKAGFETRGNRSSQIQQISIPAFMFDATSTANTYVSPNTALSGDGYASFLLGAYNNLARGQGMPVRVPTEMTNRTFGGYINDDWKVSRRLTINLGLRYEFEEPFHEAQDRMNTALNLTVPIQALQGANAPQMPATVKQFYAGQWIFNGAMQWQTSGSPGAWNGGLGTLSPRAGFALKVDDKTVIRIGYGLYYTPWLAVTDMTYGSYFYGYNMQTLADPFVQGVPQVTLDNPFPASYPIVQSVGKSLGQYTGLGDNLTWFNPNRPKQYSHRFNMSLQRQLPMGIRAELVYYLNLSNATESRNINLVDPRIAYTYGSATNIQLANPLYNLETSGVVPANNCLGTLCKQTTVPLTGLMVPYPQYGSLTVTDYDANGGSRFQQAALKLQKSYSHGLTFIGGYSYLYSYNLGYYNDVATYLMQHTWQAATNPRNRVTFAASWEIPLGHGRAFLSAAPRAFDAVIGGWNVSPMLSWRSGDYLSFGALVASGNPLISNPGPTGWFNTAMFAKLPAYTVRTNPVTYSGLTGPGFFNLDLSLAKNFRITEKISSELRMDAFNAPNTMTWNDPSTSITSTFFGKSSGQLLYNNIGIGRQAQFGFRVRF